MKLIQLLFLISSLLTYSIGHSQDRPKKKVFDIDFSGIQNKKDKDEPEKPKNPEPIDFKGVELPKKDHNLSNLAISGFNSSLNLENFGKLIPDEPQFGKSTGLKTYLDAGIPTQYLNKPDNAEFIFGDIDLGTYESKESHFYLIVKDSDIPDGDAFKVIRNDKVIFSEIILLPNFSEYKIALLDGINKFEIEATNEGSGRPATCRITAVNGNKETFFDRTINLVKGFKGKFIIVKE